MKTKRYIDFEPSFRWLASSPACMLAFGFGTGLSKKMPGTVGTLLAFIPAVFVNNLNLSKSYLFFLSFILFLVGISVSDTAEKRLAYPDYSGIVIDEIAAMMFILSVIPFSWQNSLLAFILFRLFDIYKPWPIRLVDQSLSGGLGIMLDDILAAFYVILLFFIFKTFLIG